MSGGWTASVTGSDQDIQDVCSYGSYNAWELMYNKQVKKYMDKVIPENKRNMLYK